MKHNLKVTMQQEQKHLFSFLGFKYIKANMKALGFRKNQKKKIKILDKDINTYYLKKEMKQIDFGSDIKHKIQPR